MASPRGAVRSARGACSPASLIADRHSREHLPPACELDGHPRGLLRTLQRLLSRRNARERLLRQRSLQVRRCGQSSPLLPAQDWGSSHFEHLHAAS